MSMKVMLVGGGSGGHLTPLIPVATALKTKDATIEIVSVGQKKDPLNKILDGCAAIDKRAYIQAGKYRRYHGESLLRKIIDVKTIFWNVRDAFRFLIGIVQAWLLLGKEQPTVIFLKGGYVGAPVGIAAHMRGIPYITHDSDAMISLAHRLIAKHATLHLTAYEPHFYHQYDQQKTFRVGIPLRGDFALVDDEVKRNARQELRLDTKDKVIFVVGGGLGARSINEVIIQQSPRLLQNEYVHIFHVTGQKLFEETRSAYERTLKDDLRARLHLFSFLEDIHLYSAAADIVVTRAGATNMAEFALQAKACIVVPNPLLSGGHQLLNAREIQDKHAAIIVNEPDATTELVGALEALLADEKRRHELEASIQLLATPHAAEAIAEKIIQVAQSQKAQ